MHRKQKYNSGFTLMEMMLAMAITAIFITGLIALDRFLSDSQFMLSLASQSFNEANIGVDAMVKEIRNAKYADTGAYPLELTNDQEITFYSNVDDDAETEKIRYYLDGNELKRGVIQPTGNPIEYLLANEQVSLVINYVQNQANPIFYYYNGDWPSDTANNPLPSPRRLTDTKLIQVVLTINPKPLRSESEFTIESYMQIRNLKTNL